MVSSCQHHMAWRWRPAVILCRRPKHARAHTHTRTHRHTQTHTHTHTHIHTHTHTVVHCNCVQRSNHRVPTSCFIDHWLSFSKCQPEVEVYYHMDAILKKLIPVLLFKYCKSITCIFRIHFNQIGWEKSN